MVPLLMVLVSDHKLDLQKVYKLGSMLDLLSA